MILFRFILSGDEWLRGFSPEVVKDEMNRPRSSLFQCITHLSDETGLAFKKVVSLIYMALS
jgi:hypothetical protein